MDSLAHIQKFVNSNANILLQVFRTSATASSLVVLSAGLIGLYSPATLAKNFGIPIDIPSSPQKTKRSGDRRLDNIRSRGKDSALVEAWITAWAAREVFLGCLILSLLYLNELRAVSVAITLGTFVGFGDTIAVLKGGEEGAYKIHLIPTLCFTWLGPLGLLLSSGI